MSSEIGISPMSLKMRVFFLKSSSSGSSPMSSKIRVFQMVFSMVPLNHLEIFLNTGSFFMDFPTSWKFFLGKGSSSMAFLLEICKPMLSYWCSASFYGK